MNIFETLKAQDREKQLKQAAGQYEEGITLYKAFVLAVEAKDRARAPRLALKLDNWHNALTTAQKTDFAALLVQKGIIAKNSMLGQAITMFNGRIHRIHGL